MAKSCCNHNKTAKKCRRKDGKTFKLPRRFSKKRCMSKVRGYSMKSSCGPYNHCKKGGVLKQKSNFFLIPKILKIHMMFILIRIPKIQYQLNLS